MRHDYIIQLAGFKLIGTSEINANPKDQRDHPVWNLPPTLLLGQKDRAKYLAIGESDRMTLKFTSRRPKRRAVSVASRGGAMA